MNGGGFMAGLAPSRTVNGRRFETFASRPRRQLLAAIIFNVDAEKKNFIQESLNAEPNVNCPE